MNNENTNEGNEEGKENTASSPLIEKTDAAALRLEEANARKEKLLDREEELYSRQKLGGESNAGQENIVKVSEEDKKKNQAADFFEGTALGDAIKKA